MRWAAVLLLALPLLAAQEIFTDVTAQAGIVWRHFSGESPDRYLIEAMGGGVAFLDFDQDGRQDLFFVNGGETPHGKIYDISGRFCYGDRFNIFISMG